MEEMPQDFVSMESVGEMLFDVDGPGPRSIML